MINITEVSVFNLSNAIRGARNPMNSWGRSDSYFDAGGEFVLGENDLRLAKKLRAAGSDHRKFMRQIFLSADILAPMYWWKEFDTYKVGTTANSTSTMHKIHSKQFQITDFSADHLDGECQSILTNLLDVLETLRQRYILTKNKSDWYKIIQLLPSSYNQLRTCTMTYENLINMYSARKSHKLDEWRNFCEWIETLPYAHELICCDV